MSRKKRKPEPKTRKVGRPPERILEPELVAAKLVEMLGNITYVARHFGVTRGAIHNLIRGNEHLQQIHHDCKESMDDSVENRFFADCLKDNPAYQTSRIFYLKTRCKARGYIERQQIEHGEMGSTEVVEEVIATRANPTDRAAG